MNLGKLHTRVCLHCGKEFIGRLDKKFCDDHCRSLYHNYKNSRLSLEFKKIDSNLKKNRRILSQLFTTHKSNEPLLPMHLFQELGYLFQYHTHIDKLENGDTCFWCYEFGIIPLGNLIKVIRQK